MNVFVDTSAFYAILSRTDAHHQEAAAQWNRLLDDPNTKLFTSNYVVVETCALVGSRLGRAARADFCRALLPATTVFWVDEPTHHAAVEMMLLPGAEGPSLVDCASHALMRARGMRRAFAYDRRFAQYTPGGRGKGRVESGE